jgi:putative MATE family efflux protein
MKKKRYKLLGEESINKLLWRFSVPAITGMLIQAFYNIIDTIFIGHSVGTLGIAGLSVAFPFQMIIVGVAQMVAFGSGPLLSQALGARNYKKARQVFGNSLTLSVIAGVIITVVGLLNSTFLMKFFGATPTILPYAKNFMDISLLGTVFITFGMTTNNVIRSEGHANLAMMTMLISAIVNTILDAIFIFGFGMGVRGAAFATVIAQATTAIWLYIYFRRRQENLRITFGILKIRLKIIFEILKTGVSSFTRGTVITISSIILNHFLGYYGGDVSIAVYGIINRIFTVVLMPIIGISIGMQPILGYNYGAKLYKRSKEVIESSIVASTFIAVAAVIIFLVFPILILRAFTSDPVLLSEGRLALYIMSPTVSLLGFQIMTSTMFQTLSKVRPAFWLSISRSLVCMVPLLFILPPLFGLNGIWIANPIADSLTFLFALYMFRREMRTNFNQGRYQQKHTGD